MWKRKIKPRIRPYEGNAWSNEQTGINGLSRVIDTGGCGNISVFGKTSEAAEIIFLVSEDGLNFYQSKDISEKIQTEEREVRITNIAEPPESFSASRTDDGSPQNLAESRPVEDNWRVDVAGVLQEDLWVKFDAGEEKEINSYSLVSSSDRNYPRAWTFQGSNDNSTWTELDSRSGTVFENSFPVNFALSQPETYRYFRLLITEGGATGPGQQRTQLNMLRLLQIEVDQENGVEDGNFNFHMTTTIGARYVRLLSKDDVEATITIAHKG